jgi:hypothetical protein
VQAVPAPRQLLGDAVDRQEPTVHPPGAVMMPRAASTLIDPE